MSAILMGKPYLGRKQQQKQRLQRKNDFNQQLLEVNEKICSFLVIFHISLNCNTHTNGSTRTYKVIPSDRFPYYTLQQLTSYQFYFEINL